MFLKFKDYCYSSLTIMDKIKAIALKKQKISEALNFAKAKLFCYCGNKVLL